MQVQVELPFGQLLNAVKSLPKPQLKKLKAAIDKTENNGSKKEDLRTLLLNGPVATKEQLKVIAENRKAINKWRTK